MVSDYRLCQRLCLATIAEVGDYGQRLSEVPATMASDYEKHMRRVLMTEMQEKVTKTCQNRAFHALFNDAP